MDMHGACTTISVYENLSKNSFFFLRRKTSSMMTRRRCSRFASAKVRLFRKPAKDWERFFKKKERKGCRKGYKWRVEGGDTLFIILEMGYALLFSDISHHNDQCYLFSKQQQLSLYLKLQSKIHAPDVEVFILVRAT